MSRIVLACLALSLAGAVAQAVSQADRDTCSSWLRTVNVTVTEWADARIAACTRIIEDAGESAAGRAEAYVNRGGGYAAKHDDARAIADYTASLEIAPRSAQAYLLRGEAYKRNDDHKRAIADYTKLIELDPVQGHMARGHVYMGTGNEGDYDRAVADFTKVIETDPSFETPISRAAKPTTPKAITTALLPTIRS